MTVPSYLSAIVEKIGANILAGSDAILTEIAETGAEQVDAVNLAGATNTAASTAQANRAALLAYLASQPFADTTALNAYTNDALVVGDSVTIPGDGRYEVTSLSPLTWVRQSDSDGKVAADQVAAAAAEADRAEDAATSIGSATISTVAGVKPVATATLTNFANNTTTAFFQATRACTIDRFGINVRTVNSGAVSIQKATGTLPNLTAVGSPTVMPVVTATGANDWSVAGGHFAGIDLAIGEWLLVHLPATTGVAAYTVDYLGNTHTYATPADTSGAVTASTTVANKSLNAYVGYSYVTTAVPRTSLADNLTLAGVSTYSPGYLDVGVGGAVAGANSIDASATARQCDIGGNDTSATAEVLEIETWVSAVGSGSIKIIKATRSGTSYTYTFPAIELPAPVSTGQKVWTKAGGDFEGITLAPNERLILLSPSGGVSTTSTPRAGSTFYFRNSSTISAVGTFSTSPAVAHCSRFRLAAGSMQLTTSGMADSTAKAVSQWVRSAPTQWDLFLIAGQSNAEGRGDKSLSENVPAGVLKVWNGSAFVETLTDPIGGATTGSAWPAFVNRYYQRTGRGVLLVEQATGGTNVVANAGDTGANWSPTGTLRATAATAYEAAYTAALAAGLATRKAGLLWIQGEADAKAITAGTVATVTGLATTATDYYNGLSALVSYFATQFDFGTNCLPFIMSQIGTENTGDPTGHQQVRAQQAKLARNLPNVHLGHFGAVNFLGRGYMADLDHYTQAAYNEIGQAMAEVAAAVAFASESGIAPSVAPTTQSGTSYTAVEDDSESYIQFTNAAAVAFTLPPNSSVGFPIGTVITLEQNGAGAVTITAGAGVTLRSRGGRVVTAGQYAVAQVKKVALNTWSIMGDVS